MMAADQKRLHYSPSRKSNIANVIFSAKKELRGSKGSNRSLMSVGL